MKYLREDFMKADAIWCSYDSMFPFVKMQK
jgi:hypothetical protein